MVAYGTFREFNEYPILYLTNTDDDKDRYERLMVAQDMFIPYLNLLKRCSIECSVDDPT
jgi:hypothetical protein